MHRAVTTLISSTAKATRRFGNEIVELIYPPACAVCAGPIGVNGEQLCPKCWSDIQQNLLADYCPVCGHNTGPYALIDGRCHRCQRRRPHIQNIVRVGEYDGPIRELILSQKFRGQSRLDRLLGTMLAAAIAGQNHILTADMLVPIPLHWRRYLKRKYNQSELLAQAAARELCRQGVVNIKLDHNLVRIRNTAPQTSMAHSHRIVNLHRAFAVRDAAVYHGKHVCLVDDVTTTGTTLRVAAHTLKKAGAKTVSAAVLAVAAND